ncbi:hypothetical protein [Ornithinimicrobium sp. LYQ103]|uniref:hypothetical protein n=1 Tax=Ornithinimicrobium sp. LYQ103 TaxID=3378796 RepID=UPI003853EE95
MSCVSRVVRLVLLGVVALVVAVLALDVTGPAAATPSPAEVEVVVEYYYGEDCPVCAVTEPWLKDLEARTPGMRLVSVEVWNDDVGRVRLQDALERYHVPAVGVPVVFVGERAWVGFREGVHDVQIEEEVQRCAETGCPDPADVRLPEGTSGTVTTGEVCEGDPDNPFRCAPADDTSDVLRLPLVGDVHLGERSLLVSTVLIAVVDGFNPCSLWVLTVLIALSLHSGSRRRTMIIGVTFITVTALIYALFIAGLFTVFTVVAFAPWIRMVVATVALLFAVVSIKDYFWFKRGLSFTIADDKKPGIYRGMRRVLAQGDNLLALVGATVVLAAGVSLVEFGCTAGFPLLWTNLLSAQQAPVTTFVVLLLVYMLIYQLDELAIFTTAVVTMRASRMQERHGRILKLVGGMLMLTLAVVVIVDPDLMSGVGSSLVVFALALGATALLLVVHRVLLPRLGIHVGSETDLAPDVDAPADKTSASGTASPARRDPPPV